MPDKDNKNPNAAYPATIERRCIPVEYRAIGSEGGDGGDLIVEGYSAVFNSGGSEAYGFHEEIAPGAFAESIANDDIRMLFNHDANHVLARTKNGTLTLKEDKKGLFSRGEWPDTQFARDLHTQVERGDVDQQSFAFDVIEESWEYPENELPRRTLIKVRLYDVSIVTYPFYEDTNIAIAKRKMEVNREKHTQELVDAAKRAMNAAINAKDDEEYRDAVVAELGSVLPGTKPMLTDPEPSVPEPDDDAAERERRTDYMRRKQQIYELDANGVN